MAQSIGITGERTAANIAKAVCLYGWDNCGSHVLEILKKDDVIYCCDTCSTLAFNLQALECHNAALMVDKRTLLIAMADVHLGTSLIIPSSTRW